MRQRIGKRVRSWLALLFGLTSFCLAASAAAPGAKTRLKEPLAGLVQMGDIGFHRQDGGVVKPGLATLQRFPGVFGGMVINITWEQIEPARGAFDTQVIDRVLEEMRIDNRANPAHPLAARLRVWPGPNAPPWAKNLDGPPVAILHKDLPIVRGQDNCCEIGDSRATWLRLSRKPASHQLS